MGKDLVATGMEHSSGNNCFRLLLLTAVHLVLLCILVGCSYSFSLGTPMPTVSSHPTVFRVIRVAISATPSSYRGPCDEESSITVTVRAAVIVSAHSPGGTVTYTWQENDPNFPPGPTFTLPFAPGVTSQSVSMFMITQRSLGTRPFLWEVMRVLSPNVLTSPHASFQLFCQ